MKVVIADDEPLALRRLQSALACIPEVEVVAAASGGAEASRLIAQFQPDLVVLDIEMPDRDGLSVVTDIPADAHAPEVIFVTAFRHYAVQAFEMAAADYLTKPVAFERLRDAVRRAADRIKTRGADARFADLQAMVAALQAEAEGAAPAFETHLWVRRRREMVRLDVEDIDLVEAQGDYVMVHTGDVAYLHRETLSAIEERLDPGAFVRCHRSMIVNLARVRGIRRRRGRGLQITLTDGRIVVVGPSYVDRLMTAARLERWRE